MVNCIIKTMDGVHIMWNISIYAQYYDIDIRPIFTDKTTYFHWLPKDLINIIKSYDLYDIQEGDMIYYKYANCYAKIVEIDCFLVENYTCEEYKDIKKWFEDGRIKIYRKRPSCNIV